MVGKKHTNKQPSDCIEKIIQIQKNVPASPIHFILLCYPLGAPSDMFTGGNSGGASIGRSSCSSRSSGSAEAVAAATAGDLVPLRFFLVEEAAVAIAVATAAEEGEAVAATLAAATTATAASADLVHLRLLLEVGAAAAAAAVVTASAGMATVAATVGVLARLLSNWQQQWWQRIWQHCPSWWFYAVPWLRCDVN